MAKNMIRSNDWPGPDSFGRLGKQVPLKQLDEKLDWGLGLGLVARRIGQNKIKKYYLEIKFRKS